MKDIFGREALPGDIVITQGTRDYKGLNKRYVCKETINFGQKALVVAKSKDGYDAFVKTGKIQGWGTENTRSAFIIFQRGSHKLLFGDPTDSNSFEPLTFI